MKFFGRQKPAELPRSRTPLRQRPDTAASAQRSASLQNTGRRDQTALALSRGSVPPEPLSRHRLIFGALSVVIVSVGLLLLSLSPKPHIILLQDATTAYFLHGSAVYQQTAEQSLASSLFNRNKLTIDTNAVRLALLKKYPEIKNVSIVLPVFGHQPQIFIEPYTPSFILTTSSSEAFLLDATGRALTTAGQIPGIAKLDVPTLQDRADVTVKLGSPALPSTTVSFTQTVVAALKASQLSASALVLPSAYELDATITGTPYYVKFNLQDDPLQQVGTYLATRQRLASDHVTVGQYIDVRVPERAYYK
jgi:hypothetical protein